MGKLLLIPGMMCDERLFAHQAAALGSRWEVVCARLDGPPTIAGLAERLLAAHQGRLCVAGLSMGGIVAMEMARQAPGRIERLALLDTNHHADLASRFEVRNRQIADVRAGKLAEIVAAELAPTYFARINDANPELPALVCAMAASLGAAVFERQSLALRDRRDQSDALRTYRGPALVLCGEEDRLCPPSRHVEMADLLDDANLEIIEHAGHLSTIERPEIVTAALEHWLLRPARQPSNTGERS